MSERAEITFMQTRLIRLASEEWHLPIEQIIYLFKKVDVLMGFSIAKVMRRYWKILRSFLKERG